MDLQLLTAALTELGEPDYRAKQVWRWLASGVAGYDEMTDLPLSLRTQLAERVPLSSLTVVDEAHASDGTVKVLLNTADGRPVEAVLMRYRDGRRSLCLSSQSGCPLTCTFCATGQMRFGRNLTASEILDQALALPAAGARRPRRVHGHGRADDEPRRGPGRLRAPARPGDQPPSHGDLDRRLDPGDRPLAQTPMPIRLALSLHAADESLRSELMPVNDRYALSDVLAACRAYYERKRRMIFVEYVMLAGVNDSYVQARQLADVLDPRIFKVNLIPFNPDRRVVRGLEPEGDRGVPRRARAPRDRRHRAPHARP